MTIHSRVMEFALQQKRMGDSIQELERKISRLERRFLDPLREELRNLKKARDDSDSAFRGEMLEYYRKTGIKKLHAAVQVRERHKLKYDQQSAMFYAALAAPELVETKFSLRADKFEAAYNAGLLNWVTESPAEAESESKVLVEKETVASVAISNLDSLVDDTDIQLVISNNKPE